MPPFSMLPRRTWPLQVWPSSTLPPTTFTPGLVQGMRRQCPLCVYCACFFVLLWSYKPSGAPRVVLGGARCAGQPPRRTAPSRPALGQFGRLNWATLYNLVREIPGHLGPGKGAGGAATCRERSRRRLLGGSTGRLMAHSIPFFLQDHLIYPNNTCGNETGPGSASARIDDMAVPVADAGTATEQS